MGGHPGCGRGGRSRADPRARGRIRNRKLTTIHGLTVRVRPPSARGETQLRDFASELAARLSPDVDNVVFFEAVDSTHASALRLIEQVDNEELCLRATVLVAAAQSRGVGRGSRRWVSPHGSLNMSWLGPRLSEEILPRLPMIAAAAAHAAITAAGVEDAAIKWPNDILVEGRKLAGLLIHSRRGDAACVTVGFGLNVRPVTQSLDEPIHPPISLAEIVGDEGLGLRMLEAAVRFVGDIHLSLADSGPALHRWRARLIHREADPITVRLGNGDTISGTFAGLTDEGFLRLLTDTGERVITSGDVIES